jgi:nucleotide-binding universal stress UspA family protein
MYKYKRLLVCLDRSETDKALYKAAKLFAQTRNAQSIYFLHVAKSLELPTGIHEKYPDLIAPIDETIEHDIRMTIDDFTRDAEIDISVDIREGNVTDQILKWSSEKDIDLILLGKKPHDIGSGHHSDKVVNAAHCSVMLIPQGFNVQNGSKILVPTDFSEASHEAFEKVIEFAKGNNASVICFHAYEVPTGYHTTGKTYDEFAEIMLQNAKEHYAEFLDSELTNGVHVECVYKLDKHGHPHKLIAQTAAELNVDLIVLGSKGRTGLSSVLLGSVAAKLIKTDFDIPVLIVKGKHENLGLLKALLEL